MTTAPQVIEELWAHRLNASDLSNVERYPGDGPEGGGGQLYIQLGKLQVPAALKFLRVQYNDLPVRVEVTNIGTGAMSWLEFDTKSNGRMRLPNQNRHRGTRLPAWSAAVGFPQLPRSEAVTATAANTAWRALGGLHIFLARDDQDVVWAGFTKGVVTGVPFAALVSGAHPGGYWKYEPAP